MSDTSKPAHPKAAKYGTPRPKVPAFARYEGTSAWKKDRRRGRAYAAFKATQQSKDMAAPSH